MPTDGTQGTDAETEARNPDQATPRETLLLVSALLLIFLFLAYVLLLFWPARDAPAASEATFLGIRLVELGTETRWFVLVMAGGALGSFVHVATSAGDYIGNRRLVRSWIFWYLLRLPVGSSLALLVYLLLRGGVLTGTPLVDDQQQPYGIIGLSALAGMFAKKASNKLGEVFEMLFQTQKDAELADKIAGTQPVLEMIVPNPLEAVGDNSASITLTGKNFQPGSRIKINGDSRKPNFVSDTELSLTLGHDDLQEAREVKVLVETPNVEEGKSDTLTLKIKEKPPTSKGKSPLNL